MISVAVRISRTSLLGKLSMEDPAVSVLVPDVAIHRLSRGLGNSKVGFVAPERPKWIRSVELRRTLTPVRVWANTLFC